MAHITVPDENPLYEEAVGATAKSAFVITFTVFDKDDLRCTADGVEQTIATFAGNAGTTGGYDGGTVNLAATVQNKTVLIWSEAKPARTTDFTEGPGMSADDVNTELDKLTARQRDLRLRMRRTPVIAYSASSKSLAATDAGQVFSNVGTASGCNYTLPSASRGLSFEFVAEIAANLKIAAKSGDSIRNAGALGTQIVTSAIGSTIRLRAINKDTWAVLWKNGSSWVLS